MEGGNNISINEKDKTLFRSFMNTKIDIFQPNDGYVIRNSQFQKFQNSYEHRLMQDSSANILSNASNLLVYSLSKNIDGISRTKYQLKKIFVQNKIEDGQYDSESIEKKYEDFHNKTMRKKLQNDVEFQTLGSFLEHPRFEELMRTNPSFLRYIMNHKYIKYHPKYEEIKQQFNQSTCPMFNGNPNEEDIEMEDEEN